MLPLPERCLIVDLEATCCNDKSIHRTEREVIEIGAVILDTQSLKIRAEYQCYVQPIRHPNLTPFCTKLTGIHQEQVDAAKTFPASFAEFAVWVESYMPATFFHWGSYDRKALMADCAFHKIHYTLPATSIDFKKMFYREMEWGNRSGLGETIKRTGLTFEGQAHSALADAKNMARLVEFLLRHLGGK